MENGGKVLTHQCFKLCSLQALENGLCCQIYKIVIFVILSGQFFLIKIAKKILQ
jgi:hypothetical protein